MKPLIFVFLLMFTGCAIFQSSDNTTEETASSDDSEEVYVFDEVPSDTDNEANEEEIKSLEEELDRTMEDKNTKEVDVFDEPIAEPQNPALDAESYYLQLGAFSSLKRAEEFAKDIESQVPFKLSILYNSQTSYYNVRSSAYSTRQEVELLRDEFWNRNLFKDAFIVTE